MNNDVQQKFKTYPEDIAVLLNTLRNLIYEVAENDDITELEETLKWSEPSYISKIGSTIRFDWKAKSPEQYCMYFNCQSKLIETFKELYGDLFTFEGNRAIVFKVNQAIPITALSHCISMALRYKKIKHLNLLGA